MSGWFPRPTEPQSIRLLDSGGELDEQALFRLLTLEGQEWPHKVGVAGRAEGSGKPTTRLLAARGWVLKTDLARRAESWDEALTALRRQRDAGRSADVWHPSKCWAVFQVGGSFYPLTACHELTTLRGLSDVQARVEGWTEMLRLALRVARDLGIGLDLNPANFGQAAGDARLYYLDDELYERSSLQQLANAIVARIPEEPEVDEERWRDWGSRIGALLQGDPAQLREIMVAVDDYPLTERFAAARLALSEGARRSGRVPTSWAQRELVCVFADVHANLPALEAILATAAQHRVSRYLFLGDAVGYGPHPKQCIARLAELRDAVLIRGNHDHCVATQQLDSGMNGLARACAEWTTAQLGAPERAWLAALALEHREGEWLAVHGAPRDPRRLLAYVYELTFEDNLGWLAEHGPRLCFHGHSHIQTTYADLVGGPRRLPAAAPADLSLAAGVLINPGSVGQPRDRDPRAAFGLFEPHGSRWTPLRVAYDLQQTVNDLTREGLPPEAARRLVAGT
jgi:diadenosine tetraphosphatase ApaH/serine/threonine PP2A family protein phosphatase